MPLTGQGSRLLRPSARSLVVSMGPQLESPSLKHLRELTVRRLLPFAEHLGFGLIELGCLIRPDFGITYG